MNHSSPPAFKPPSGYSDITPHGSSCVVGGGVESEWCYPCTNYYYPNASDPKNVSALNYRVQGDDSEFLVDHFEKFLEKREQDERPWLAHLCFHSIHEPHPALPEYYNQYEVDQDYIGALTQWDVQIGRLMSLLSKFDAYDNTLILYSADNGPHQGIERTDIRYSTRSLRQCKASMWEGGIRVVGFVNGAGLDERVKGTVNHNLFHISDWYHTIFELVSQGEKKPSLKPNERPFLDGDGISQWKTLSSPDVVGERNEIFIATQADGSQLQAHALRVGEMKILKYPILLYNKPLWYVVKKFTQQEETNSTKYRYPPPGKAWNYTKFTVQCGEPKPSKLSSTECMQDWCLFNISSDPCEYHNLASTYPDIVESMKSRLETLSKTTVLTWVNYAEYNNASLPTNYGPVTPIIPDSHPNVGPTEYQGLWSPWLSEAEDSELYPSKYVGPGYP